MSLTYNLHLCLINKIVYKALENDLPQKGINCIREKSLYVAWACFQNDRI